MRGTVTLRGRALDPAPPARRLALSRERDIVIFLAFGVIVATLVLQGTTLEALIRRLGHPRGREPPEGGAARAHDRGRGGPQRPADSGGRPPTTADQNAALGLVIAEYEQRLAVLTAEGETQRSAHRRRSGGHRYRSAALKAERKALDSLWRSGAIIDEVHRPLQQLLDHEESMLRALAPEAETEGLRPATPCAGWRAPAAERARFLAG